MKPKLLFTAAILSLGVIATGTLAEAANNGGMNSGRDTPTRGVNDPGAMSSSGREDNSGYLSSGPNWKRWSLDSSRHNIRSHRPVRAPSWWRALWD